MNNIGEKIRQLYFPIKLSEETFMAMNECCFSVSAYSLDKCRFPHGRTKRQEEQDRRQSVLTANAYYEKRRKTRELYQELVRKGLIIPLSSIEKTIKKANGHPDNPSVQAARRMCEKRGIDWHMK